MKNIRTILALAIVFSIFATCIALPAVASTDAESLVVNFVRKTSMTGNGSKFFGSITATGTGRARVGGLVKFTSTGSFSSPKATVTIEIGDVDSGNSLAKATVSSALSGEVPSKNYIFVGGRFSFSKGQNCCYKVTSTGFPSGLAANYCGYLTSKDSVTYEEIKYGWENGQ